MRCLDDQGLDMSCASLGVTTRGNTTGGEKRRREFGEVTRIIREAPRSVEKGDEGRKHPLVIGSPSLSP